MTFAQQMVETKLKLEQQGHSVLLPVDAEIHVNNPSLIDDLDADARHLRENDILRKCFQRVAECDAVLFLNYPKNGISGYIGTSSLMEMGLAHHLGKKLFLLHDTPSPKQARWAHEVSVMAPIILKEDFSKLK